MIPSHPIVRASNGEQPKKKNIGGLGRLVANNDDQAFSEISCNSVVSDLI